MTKEANSNVKKMYQYECKWCGATIDRRYDKAIINGSTGTTICKACADKNDPYSVYAMKESGMLPQDW